MATAVPEQGYRDWRMGSAVPEQGYMDWDGKLVPTCAVVIADGDEPLPADKFSNPVSDFDVAEDGFAAFMKARRQGRFPVKLLQHAFRIKVEGGQASFEADRRHILNTLARRPLGDDPPASHDEYDRIDKLLHSHYALGGLARCFAAGGEALEQCLAALRASPPPLDRFCFVVEFDTATVHQLIELLPPTLRFLQLRNARMSSLPDCVGRFTLMETLDLAGCNVLTTLPDTIGNLAELVTLNLGQCQNLMCLPDSIGCLAALRTLDLSGCKSLVAPPETVGRVSALRTLWLTALPLLRSVNLWDCKNLTVLPDGIGKLTALTILDLRHCENLAVLPESIGELTALRKLKLGHCKNLTNLPDTIGNLAALETLDLCDCCSLVTLPDSVCQLTQLDEDSRACVARASDPESRL